MNTASKMPLRRRSRKRGMVGEYFITPHAVNQFRCRIAHTLTYNEALRAIIKALQKDVQKSKKSGRRKQKSLILYVSGEWIFRAVVVGKTVVTITIWDR